MLRQPESGNRQPSGFTLIEILVVMVILGVLAAALTLAVGGSGGERRLAREAEQTQALLGFACEQAELTGREIGVSINISGYRFSHLERDTWETFAGGELRPRKWSSGGSAALSRDGHPVEITPQYPDKPQLLCFSSGELTPFRLDLGLGDVPRRYRLDGQPDGTVRLVAVDTRVR
ncbi:MAG: type II secretion system minor pseudopilin GspH [Rudaea sp.]|nr:type II secretion system minor pseudopilin GspH [Rudaea sp.]